MVRHLRTGVSFPARSAGREGLAGVARGGKDRMGRLRFRLSPWCVPVQRVKIQFISGDRGGGLHVQVRANREEKEIAKAVKQGTYSDWFDFVRRCTRPASGT